MFTERGSAACQHTLAICAYWFWPQKELGVMLHLTHFKTKEREILSHLFKFLNEQYSQNRLSKNVASYFGQAG